MKSLQLRLVVFDWDGTLMDSAAVIVASLRGARASGLFADVPRPDVMARGAVIYPRIGRAWN